MPVIEKMHEERHARGRREDLAKLREGRGHRAQHGLEHDRRGALGALAQAERAEVGRGGGLRGRVVARAASAPRRAIRSERTATYASTRHTTTRAKVRKVSAAVIIANTRLGDAMALKTETRVLTTRVGKYMLVKDATHARPLTHTHTHTPRGRTRHILSGVRSSAAEHPHAERGAARVPREHGLGEDVERREAQVLGERDVLGVAVRPRRLGGTTTAVNATSA